MPASHDLKPLDDFGAAFGAPVHRVRLANRIGMSAAILTLGATLQALTAPDRRGKWDDVVLGHDDAQSYAASTHYIGSSIGRFANRIGEGSFPLGGRRIELSRNDGVNTLHGGVRGFDKAIWRVTQRSAGSVTLAHDSPDGDQGFPGALHATVTYSLAEDEPALAIEYTATTDALTVVSLTSHGYFNLAGAMSGADILDHRLMIAADAYTPVSERLIPTGELSPAAGAFDFRRSRTIGACIRDACEPQLVLGGGYDHNFALREGRTAAPKLAARLEHDGAGRVLELHTTEPGLQFYSGNSLDGRPLGKGDVLYRKSQGLCLEPQAFPDAPNKPNFPSAQLSPGETYRHRILLRFSTLP